MPRGRYYDVMFFKDPDSGAFKPAANPSVTVYEAGTTTPIAQTMYAAATGGTTLNNPITGDANGTIEFYLEDPQDVDLLVSATGFGSVTKAHVPVGSSARDLEASSATISLSGSRTFLAKHADEGTHGGLWYGKNAADKFMLALNNQGANASVSENTSLLVAQTVDDDYVNIVTGVTSTENADIGAIRATASASVNKTIVERAFEGHVYRKSPAPAGNTWVMEAGVHSSVAGSSPLHNVGIYMTSEDWPGEPASVRADVAYLGLGARGFRWYGYYLDTNGTTELWSVDQNGQQKSGNVISRTASTFSLGESSNRWLAAYLDNLLMTAGAANAPTVASRISTTDGLYWPASGQVAMTVGAADRAILSAAGLTLDDPLILTQIATPSAPASGLTSLYAKSGGGVYSRANGGSEKQHKAGGQYALAVGSTGSPTTTSASYATLAEMEITLTTTGGDLLCWFAGAFLHSDATRNIQVAFALDGAAEAFPFSIGVPVVNEPFLIVGLGRFTGVSAGSHTVRVRWLTDAATATANATQRYLMVQELPS